MVLDHSDTPLKLAIKDPAALASPHCRPGIATARKPIIVTTESAHLTARRLMCLSALAAMSAPRTLLAQTAAPLQIGLMPNISARTLLGQYQPLHDFLARSQQPVQISTAPNWSSFHERTLALEYDLVVTAAHLARVAQLDAGLVPLLSYSPNIKALIGVAKARPLKDIKDLRGECLVLSNPQSLVTMRGLQWLAEQGLQRDRDFKTIQVPTDDSAGSVVVRGDAVAALLSSGEFRATPDAVKPQFTVMTTIAEVPSFVVLASPRLPAQVRQALKTRLLAFANDSAEGKAFFGHTGFTGIGEVPPGLMASMDPYVAATRKALTPAS
jgi:phosphonate transport system substrate-binding protein